MRAYKAEIPELVRAGRKDENYLERFQSQLSDLVRKGMFFSVIL